MVVNVFADVVQVVVLAAGTNALLRIDGSSPPAKNLIHNLKKYKFTKSCHKKAANLGCLENKKRMVKT